MLNKNKLTKTEMTKLLAIAKKRIEREFREIVAADNFHGIKTDRHHSMKSIEKKLVRGFKSPF